MTTPNPFVDKPPRRRRLRSIVWAAVGCSLLAVLAAAGVGGCVYLLSHLLGNP